MQIAYIWRKNKLLDNVNREQTASNRIAYRGATILNTKEATIASNDTSYIVT